MSNPEVGSAFVKLRVDPSGFEEQIVDTVESGAEKAQDTLDQQFSQAAQKITDLQSRASAAALRSLSASALGDESLAQAEELASGLLSLQANIAQAQLAGEDALRSAASAMGAEREEFLAAAEAFQTAARIGEDTLRRSQAAGKIQTPSGAGGGILDQVGEFARASGRSGGLGGIAAVTGRLGVMGLAATTAFQSINELSRSLRTSGEDAFTTEGRFRNLGAELLTGNVIGGIKALTSDRPAELTSGLVAAIERVKDSNDSYAVTEERLLSLRRRGREEVQLYVAQLALAGAVNAETANALLKVTEQLYAQENAAKAAATAVNDVAQAIQRAGSEAAAFGERGTDFGRGVGGVGREQEQPGAVVPVTVDVSATSAVRSAVEQSIASRIADPLARAEAELKIAQDDVEAIRERNANLKKVVEGRAARYQELVEAVTRESRLENQIATLNEQAATDAKNAADAKRKLNEDAAEQAAADAKSARELALQNQIAAAALTERKADDKKAFDAALDYWRTLARSAGSALEREQAQAKVIELMQQRTAALQGDPAATAELQEARLQNALASASLTGRLSDDRKAARDLVEFWKSQVQDAEGVAKARAEGSLIDAGARLAAVDQAATDLKELRIRNRAQAARLTAGDADDKKAADDLVKFWQSQVKQAEGVEKERARSSLIAAQLARQGLNGQAGGGQGGPTTIDFLGIAQSLTRDFAGNLLPTMGKDQLAGLFQLPGIQARGTDSPEVQSANELKRIRELLEQGAATTEVTVNQEAPRMADPSGMADARFARFAMEEAFNG